MKKLRNRVIGKGDWAGYKGTSPAGSEAFSPRNDELLPSRSRRESERLSFPPGRVPLALFLRAGRPKMSHFRVCHGNGNCFDVRMKTAFALALMVLGLGLGVGSGEEESLALPMAEVTGVVFGLEDGGEALVVDERKLGLIVSAEISGGAVVAGEGGFDFRMEAESLYGEGKIEVGLDRERIASDLAMVVNAEISGDDAEAAVQLFDREGKALALDLFGTIPWRAKVAGTDTFIIPLEKYPGAVKVVFRRLAGGIVVKEILFTPVISETTMTEARERELAGLLGERLGADHAFNRIKEVKGGMAVHVMPSLAEINDVGAAVLTRAGYPSFRGSGEAYLAPIKAATSGTLYEFGKLADRFLSLGKGGQAFDWYFTSSNGVESEFSSNLVGGEMEGMQTSFGMASVPMSEGAREAFRENNGFYPLEFPIGRNAIEVLVNAGNPVREISMDDLMSAFIEGGAEFWNEIGATGSFGRRGIEVFGGANGWGTSRVFQEIVMHGENWKEGMGIGDVVYQHGVERRVGEALGGIGFAVQKTRGNQVRKVGIRSGDGEVVRATEEAVYSGKYPLQRKIYAFVGSRSLDDAAPQIREMVNLILSAEGQTMIVKGNSLPLSVEEVMEWRGKLGL